MSKYIDRIIEVLDGNDTWQAVVLSRDEMGKARESVVFAYHYLDCYDTSTPGVFASAAALIASEKLSARARAYVEASGRQNNTYVVSLKSMLLSLENSIERAYSLLADSFYGKNIQRIIKALAGEKETVNDFGDEEYEDNPRQEFDWIIEDLQEQIEEISRVRTLARYFGYVEDPDRIRIIFFENS